MLSNMASSLIMHKRINTTVAKAKALRKYIEPILTKSKTDDTNSRRVVFSYLQDKESVSELFNNVAEKIANRPGGYTRILKTGSRLGDNAEMCIMELVDFNELMLKEEGGAKAKTRRSRRGGGAKAKTETKAAPEAEVKEVEAVEEIQEENKAAEEAVETQESAAEETVAEAPAEEAEAVAEETVEEVVETVAEETTEVSPEEAVEAKTEEEPAAEESEEKESEEKKDGKGKE